MSLVTPLSGREPPLRRPAPDAVTRRLRLTSWQGPKNKRRWITNSAGVDLLELAPVAGQTLPTNLPSSLVEIHVLVNTRPTGLPIGLAEVPDTIGEGTSAVVPPHLPRVAVCGISLEASTFSPALT